MNKQRKKRRRELERWRRERRLMLCIAEWLCNIDWPDLRRRIAKWFSDALEAISAFGRTPEFQKAVLTLSLFVPRTEFCIVKE